MRLVLLSFFSHHQQNGYFLSQLNLMQLPLFSFSIAQQHYHTQMNFTENEMKIENFILLLVTLNQLTKNIEPNKNVFGIFHFFFRKKLPYQEDFNFILRLLFG